MVEFTVLGIPCLGLNGGPEFKHSEAFSFQIATDNQEETDRLRERHRRQWRQGKPVRLVQGPLGPLLADHSTCVNRGACGGAEAKRVFEAMMPMQKIDIATIGATRRG
jgi:predicted 3-demethylubiquinone-9 3-methyltransferase (glyoxalase superfamily)